MLEKIINEIKIETRQGEVKLFDGTESRVLRINFNIVDDNIYENMPNLFIKNKINFKKLINEYLYLALNFYELEKTEYNIKLILSYLFVNISPNETNDLEKYILKRIKFFEQKLLKESGEKETSVGVLKYQVTDQSLMQETPFCFKSTFEKNNSKYALPRISFGICDGIAYVYAIQNKDSKVNIDSDYNLEIKNYLNKINKGISKYRNVTPSFVVSLSLFLSFLRENNINKLKIVSPLPIRQKNRELSSEYKIKFYSNEGILSGEELELFKKEINEKRINDDYNSTTKFINCFNRLKLHFDNLFLTNLNKEITLDVINLITQTQVLSEVVKEKER